MSHWLEQLASLGSSGTSPGQDCVLISVIDTQGSCPRDPGTRMLVTATHCYGTIGGGTLEFQAIDIAHECLKPQGTAFRIDRFPLGARLGQCCGGVAQLSFERIPGQQPGWIGTLLQSHLARVPAVIISEISTCGSSVHKLVVDDASTVSGWLSTTELQSTAEQHAHALLEPVPPVPSAQPGDTLVHEACVQRIGSLLYERHHHAPATIAIFGAGHVGTALVHVLSTLPLRIVWLDSRTGSFPDQAWPNVQTVADDQPAHEVAGLPPGSCIAIMTHSHALDQAICERALLRDDVAWCGLIGSATKRRQFERRLRARGLGSSALHKLTCPIGIEGIHGKHPAAIAIAVAAQILQACNRNPHYSRHTES